MISIRPAMARGSTRLDWLNSRHTFSFAEYHDPDHMGFGPLRVINEDTVQPGSGFNTHGHRDMEILSWVLEGALEHRDSIGNGSVISPGDVQRMSAGTGIRHSEYNHSGEALVHFLQIWIVPERLGLTPGYEQKHFAPELLRDRLTLAASRDGRAGSVTVHQDADLWIGRPAAGTTVRHELDAGRGAWVQVARGAVTLADTPLQAGDGASVRDAGVLGIRAEEDSEVLLFDLPV